LLPQRSKHPREMVITPKASTSNFVVPNILNGEVDVLGVLTISCGCFERSYSNKKTPPYYSHLSFVTLRTRRPTLLRAPVYRTLSEASPWRRCGPCELVKTKRERVNERETSRE